VITEYAICALPEDNVNWRHYAIKVQRRSNTNSWVLQQSGAYFTGSDFTSPMVTDAVTFHDEQAALELADRLAPTVEVDGITAQQALERSRR
jgi:hypothetical protein